LLLIAGIGALGLGIGLLVTAMLWSGSRAPGIAGGLASIERHYGRPELAGRPGRQQRQSAELPGWARRLALRLSPAGIGSSLQHRLDLAGNPGSWTPDRILAVKGIGLVAGVLLGALIGLHRPPLAIAWAAGLGAIGFFLADVLLYNSGIKRQALVLSALPDALDMLTVCVEAGLGFDAAMAQVARNTKGPLAEEFARALQEMQIGLSRGQALRGMVARTNVPELRAFVSSLVQAGELGIPVSGVLREQAAEMRIIRRQRAEERAQKVPVKIMFPVVTCLFPALLVVIVGPGVISIAHSLFGK
jgi:tight adherence protein C